MGVGVTAGAELLETPGAAVSEIEGTGTSVAVTGQMVVNSVVTTVTTVDSAGQLVIVVAQLRLCQQHALDID